jgi:hypothetical protein
VEAIADQPSRHTDAHTTPVPTLKSDKSVEEVEERGRAGGMEIEGTSPSRVTRNHGKSPSVIT